MGGRNRRGYTPNKGQQDAALRRARSAQERPEMFGRCSTCRAPYYKAPVVLGGIKVSKLHLCQACADKLFDEGMQS